MSEDRQLKVMRALENNPEMTQRELASTLGISLGAINFCLKALLNIHEKSILKSLAKFTCFN